MNENTNRLSQAAGMYGADRQSLCLVGSEELCGKVPGACGSTAPADRGDAIREIATNLERLCIEYDCLGRVSPHGVERRAVWAQFKAQIEALRGMA